MSVTQLPQGHPPVATGRIGVLLVNLGTPDAPDTASVRRYLREFLSDSRVIEVPRPVWWLVLNLFILPFRPARTAHAYATALPLKVGPAPDQPRREVLELCQFDL